MESKDWSSISQPMTAMDSLTSALNSNIIPNQEYLLQGSVLDTAVEVLLQRLRGLCDNVDTGPETFHDHEMCFSIMNIESGTSPQPLVLRVRRALDYQDMPWQLRYIGQPEGTGKIIVKNVSNLSIVSCSHPQTRKKLQPIQKHQQETATFVSLFKQQSQGVAPHTCDKSRPTLVRSSIDIGTSSTVVEFLQEMGCRMDFEYIVRGYMFRKGRMKVMVSKIFKMNQQKAADIEAISQSYLVELSVLAPTGQDIIAEDMRNFAEQLKPLVILEKVDYKRLPLSMGP